MIRKISKELAGKSSFILRLLFVLISSFSFFSCNGYYMQPPLEVFSPDQVPVLYERMSPYIPNTNNIEIYNTAENAKSSLVGEQFHEMRTHANFDPIPSEDSGSESTLSADLPIENYFEVDYLATMQSDKTKFNNEKIQSIKPSSNPSSFSVWSFAWMTAAAILITPWIILGIYAFLNNGQLKEIKRGFKANVNAIKR